MDNHGESCITNLNCNLLHFQEMTMTRRWSKPKSYSGEETPQPPGGLGDLISKCITRDAAVSVIVPSPNPIRKLLPPRFLSVHLWGRFPDGSEPGGGAEAEEWNESGSSTETETHGTELFWLDYQADSGAITSFLVHKVNTQQLSSDCI